MLKETEERKVNEIAVGGRGVTVAVTHFPIKKTTSGTPDCGWHKRWSSLAH